MASWTMQDLGGPPLNRLRLLPADTPLEEMAGYVASGAIGPWPMDLPAPAGTVTRPLAGDCQAPHQILISHAPSAVARQFAAIAGRLADTQGRRGS